MVWKLFTKKKMEYLMIKHMYLTILTIKQLQHENLAQSIKTITKFTKCPLYIFVVMVSFQEKMNK